MYCGRRAMLTADHVPPRNIFPKPRPNNLITVPACKKCNEEASKDDEYFRLMLVMRDDVYVEPNVKQLWKTSYRGLKWSTKRGMAHNLVKNIRHGPTYTNSGIYLGNRSTYNVDLYRLDRVMERIIKGLFYHHAGYVLPKEYIARSFSVDGLVNDNVWDDPELKNMLGVLSELKPVAIGKNIFSYKFLRLSDDINGSFWLFTFFSKVSFLGFTLEDQ